MSEPSLPRLELVGRADELSLLADLLAEEPLAPAVFVHGGGGIGKSSLLRELARRAAALGFEVIWLDGRDEQRAQLETPEAIAAARAAPQALLVVDAYEHVAALGGLLRAQLGDAVGARLRLLIAGRRPPEPAWSAGGWEEVVRTIALGPLDPAAAIRLLERRGVRDREDAAEIAAWAGGSPLALGLAADALLAGQPLDLGRLDTDAGIAAALMRRLAGDELDGADAEVLAVAAIARAVDARLLAAALPGVDADHAEDWLRSRSFAEPFGTRLTLHERVRRAAHGALRARDPVHERELRRRIADHVASRLALGDLWLLPDLTELIEDPAVRWGISPSHATHRFGRAEPGDAATVATRLDVAGSAWWRGVERWFAEAPEHVVVVRDAAGEIAYVGIGATPAGVPPWAAEDPVVGRWLEDSRARVPSGNALFVREAIDLSRDEGGSLSAAALGNTALVTGAGLATVECIYFNPSNETRPLREFRDALGWERAPEADVRDGEREVRCYLHDFGPGGVVEFTHQLVYRDLGLPAPAQPPPAQAGTEAVREALRTFHDPVALAASPLGRGPSAAARAESVRRLLREAVAGGFGESEGERLLRSVLERAYLDPAASHDRAQAELHLSRATYFRRLRLAVDRVAERVLGARGG